MPAPFPLPTYVYKILDSSPPSPLPPNLPTSPLDAKDAFIHLSTAQQVPRTADRFFSTADTLWLLKIPLDRVQSNTRWEEGNSDTFAHIYGPMPGKEEVSEIHECGRKQGEDWNSFFKRVEWLI